MLLVEYIQRDMPIDVAQLKDWALGKHPDTVVGLTRKNMCCPVANAIRELYEIPYDWDVDVTNMSIKLRTTRDLTMRNWYIDSDPLSEVITQLDAITGPTREVTAREFYDLIVAIELEE